MSTHGLRHSFATHLSQNGAGIVEIAECLGHASLSNTQKYVHLSLTDVIGSYDKAHPWA
jgi:integrase/recombinase XerC